MDLRHYFELGKRYFPNSRSMRHQWIRKTIELESSNRHARFTGGWKVTH